MSTPLTNISIYDLYSEWEDLPSTPFNPLGDINLNDYHIKYNIPISEGLAGFIDKTVIKPKISNWRIFPSGDLKTGYFEGVPESDTDVQLAFYCPTVEQDFTLNVSWMDTSIYFYYNGLDPEDTITPTFYFLYGPAGNPNVLKYQSPSPTYGNGEYVFFIPKQSIDIPVIYTDYPSFRFQIEIVGDTDGDFYFNLKDNIPMDISINAKNTPPSTFLIFNNTGQNKFRISKFSDTIIGAQPL